MPIKRPPLINNEIYHVIIRGVGDSLIFNNKEDRYRAIFSLYEFNTDEPVEISVQRRKRRNKIKGEQFSFNFGNSEKRNLLVEILAFCFMPNHIHLLLKQVQDDGITKFMRKFGAGYATYFNKKYNRKGHLFQGRFKAVHIEDTNQLQTVFVYIHTNPISLIDTHWKEEEIKDSAKAIKFLEKYKWSSYLDYLGKKNFPSITKRNIFQEIIGDKEDIQEFVNDWVKYQTAITEDNTTIGLE
mgnify:CR=1 FL=1